jgi:hypothetical protein
MRVSSLFAVIILSSLALCSQETRPARSMLSDLSPERLNSLVESTRLAWEELAQHAPAFKTPNIAMALEPSSYRIAIAQITAVQWQGCTTPRTKIRFHVVQLIKGKGPVADFDVESRWTPAPVLKDEGPWDISNYKPTALDLKEPKVGDRYILGFPPPYQGEKLVDVPSVIDLQDPTQAELISTSKRLLTIEASAERSGFAPWLAALDDEVPWIRDIAVHWLTGSDACNASPSCAERFSEVVKRQLQSSLPNERRQAVDWLVWVDSVSRQDSKRRGFADGMPVLPDSAIRSLFTAAVQDENAAIGDEAFEYREMSEQERGQPGECYTIIPALRKTLRTPSAEQSTLPAGFPLSYVYGCVPPRETGQR